jgi:WD40 repeat protein
MKRKHRSEELVSNKTESLIRHWVFSPIEICLLVFQFVGYQCLKTLFSKDGAIRSICELKNDRLAGGCDDYAVKIWSLKSGKCIKTLKTTSWTYKIIHLPNGNLVSVHPYTICIWDTKTWKCKLTINSFSSVVVNQVALIQLTNGNLAVGCDTAIEILNPETLNIVKTFGYTTYFNDTALIQLLDGNLAAGCDTAIEIWNPDTGKFIKTLPDSSGSCRAFCLLKNGNLVGGDEAGNVRIWNPGSGQLIKTLHCREQVRYSCVSVRALLLLDDGNFASSDDLGWILIWNSETFECIQNIHAHNGSINSIIQLSDRKLASCSYDYTIKIWGQYSTNY